MKLIFLILLFYLSVVDVIRRKVPAAICLLMGIAILVWLYIGQALKWTDSLTGACIGIVLIAAAGITGQAVGTGDGLVFLLSGLLLGFWGNMQLLVISLFIELLFIGAWELVRKVRGGRVSISETMKKRVPFLPFIFISYIYVCGGDGLFCLF